MKKYINNIDAETQTKISDFFSKSKEIERVEVPISKENSTIQDFYFELANDGQKNCCQSEILRLKKSLKEHIDKFSDLEKSISLCEKMNEKKNQQIKKLREEIGEKSVPLSMADCNLYSEFSMHFSPEKLAELRSIGSDMNKDSSFVLNIIRSFYAHNTELVCNITVTGASKKGEQKTPMEDDKLKVIQTIFRKRLEAQHITKHEQDTRFKRLNTLIKNAVINMQRTNKKGRKIILNEQDNEK